MHIVNWGFTLIFSGFNDIGYRNPEVISPNLDKLANEGVILDRNYVQAVCTPSRSAMMTGMYPYKIGRQVCISKGFTFFPCWLHPLLRSLETSI